MDSVPVEIKFHIVGFLGVVDATALSGTCRDLHSVVKEIFRDLPTCVCRRIQHGITIRYEYRGVANGRAVWQNGGDAAVRIGRNSDGVQIGTWVSRNRHGNVKYITYHDGKVRSVYVSCIGTFFNVPYQYKLYRGGKRIFDARLCAVATAVVAVVVVVVMLAVLTVGA